jgi:hypothetical protein
MILLALIGCPARAVCRGTVSRMAQNCVPNQLLLALKGCPALRVKLSARGHACVHASDVYVEKLVMASGRYVNVLQKIAKTESAAKPTYKTSAYFPRLDRLELLDLLRREDRPAWGRTDPLGLALRRRSSINDRVVCYAAVALLSSPGNTATFHTAFSFFHTTTTTSSTFSAAFFVIRHVLMCRAHSCFNRNHVVAYFH